VLRIEPSVIHSGHCTIQVPTGPPGPSRMPARVQDASATASASRAPRSSCRGALVLKPRLALAQRCVRVRSPDTSSGTSIWSSRSLRPNLASPRAAAPTMPPVQLWASSVLRPLAQALMLPHALPVVHRSVEEAEAGLSTRAALQPAATPSLAAIAPTAAEPSIDTAQFRARVTHVRQSRPPALCSPRRAVMHARAFFL
jgi:hypothetical protein